MQGLIVTTVGFEDSEFSHAYYRLREAGFDVHVATPDGEPVAGEPGYEFDADFAIEDHDHGWFAEEYDPLVVPGGRAPRRLRTEAPAAADLVSAFVEGDPPVSAICHGAQLLISADAIEGSISRRTGPSRSTSRTPAPSSSTNRSSSTSRSSPRASRTTCRRSWPRRSTSSTSTPTSTPVPGRPGRLSDVTASTNGA